MPATRDEIQPLLLAEEFSGLPELVELGEDAVPALLEILEESQEDAFLRCRCLVALGEIGSPLAAPAVIPHLASEDRTDRVHSARALANILGAEASLHLLPLLDDEVLSLRKVAIQCLGSKAGPEVLPALRQVVAESPHDFLRTEAAAAIEQIEGREPSP